MLTNLVIQEDILRAYSDLFGAKQIDDRMVVVGMRASDLARLLEDFERRRVFDPSTLAPGEVGEVDTLR